MNLIRPCEIKSYHKKVTKDLSNLKQIVKDSNSDKDMVVLAEKELEVLLKKSN